MFNKKLGIILILLTIFCFGVAVSSVSANGDDINLTTTSDGGDLIHDFNEDTVSVNEENQKDENIVGINEEDSKDKLEAQPYQRISIETKDYDNYENSNQLVIRVLDYDSNGRNTGYSSNTGVAYKITNEDGGKVVYSKTSWTDRTGTCTFDSNFNIFKNKLGQGYYTCELSTDSTKAPYTWTVGYPKGQLKISILTSQYTNCKNTLSLGTKVLFDTNRYLYTDITYTIVDSNNVEVFKTTKDADGNGVCNFNSNYNIFNGLSEGMYKCKLSVRSCIVTGIGYFTGNTLEWDVLVDDSVTFTPPKPSTPTKKSTSTKTSHYVRYVKIGKYKVKVWSDDSLNAQKSKVRVFLKYHVKKAHKFKVHGYKFKVSAKMYRKILYYNKYGFDGKMGYANFKVKTNKYKTYKVPIYETYKITKKVWAYKKVLSGWARWSDDWYDDEYYSLTNYFKKGWISYGSYSDEWSSGVDHYTKLKKKVKKTITKKKIVGYETVKVKVYAYGMLSHNKVAVQFWGLKNGQKYAPITNYCKLK